MSQVARAALGAAALAALGGGAAKADIFTLPTSDAVAQTVYCDASTPACAAGGVAYTAFTVAQRSEITGFQYYSIFTGADYVSTNWSIWTGASSPTLIASGTIQGGAKGYDDIDGLELISATLASANAVTLEAGQQYWIGLQNNLTSASGTSVYGSLDSNSLYKGGTLFDGTTYVGASSGWTLPAYNSHWSHWPWQNAALSIATQDAPAAPEPSTWAMMLVGFAGLAWTARARLSRQTA